MKKLIQLLITMVELLLQVRQPQNIMQQSLQTQFQLEVKFMLTLPKHLLLYLLEQSSLLQQIVEVIAIPQPQTALLLSM